MYAVTDGARHHLLSPESYTDHLPIFAMLTRYLGVHPDLGSEVRIMVSKAVCKL